MLVSRFLGLICRQTVSTGIIFISYRRSPGVKEYIFIYIEGPVCNDDRSLVTGNSDCFDHQSHSTFEFGEDIFDIATNLLSRGIGFRSGPFHRPTCGLVVTDAAGFADPREVFFEQSRVFRGLFTLDRSHHADCQREVSGGRHDSHPFGTGSDYANQAGAASIF